VWCGGVSVMWCDAVDFEGVSVMWCGMEWRVKE
jgi:hypothetical protein